MIPVIDQFLFAVKDSTQDVKLPVRLNSLRDAQTYFTKTPDVLVQVFSTTSVDFVNFINASSLLEFLTSLEQATFAWCLLDVEPESETVLHNLVHEAKRLNIHLHINRTAEWTI